MNKKVKLEAMWLVAVLLVLGIGAGLELYSTSLPNFSVAEKDTSHTKFPANTNVINVTGEQWAWLFTNSTGQTTTDTFTITVNTTYTLVVQSEKGSHEFAVIHDLYFPQFGIQVYAVPGQTNSITFTPTHTGTYVFECVEYCGYDHYLMRGYVKVVA